MKTMTFKEKEIELQALHKLMDYEQRFGVDYLETQENLKWIMAEIERVRNAPLENDYLNRRNAILAQLPEVLPASPQQPNTQVLLRCVKNNRSVNTETK